jgi:hypothetical protein
LNHDFVEILYNLWLLSSCTRCVSLFCFSLFPLFLNLESVVVPIYGTKYLSGICRWEESDQVGDRDFYSELPAFSAFWFAAGHCQRFV